MLIINKPRLPPIHLNRPTAAFEPDSAAPRLVLRLQWACFGGLVGRLGLLMIKHELWRSGLHTPQWGDNKYIRWLWAELLNYYAAVLHLHTSQYFPMFSAKLPFYMTPDSFYGHPVASTNLVILMSLASKDIFVWRWRWHEHAILTKYCSQNRTQPNTHHIDISGDI